MNLVLHKNPPIMDQQGLNPFLRVVLKPLSKFYSDPTTIEIRMGQPQTIITDRRGVGLQSHDVPALTQGEIERICLSLANSQGIYFDITKAPKLSCVLPDGRHRFECLIGASVQNGVSLAIRCKHPFKPSWTGFGIGAASSINKSVAASYSPATIKDYLIHWVKAGANMIVSGGTNTGKTTLLNMLLECLPDDARVIAVEDTPELKIDRFWNGVGLIAAREESRGNAGMVSWRELYDHTTRITPDQIIFGEISTSNAFAALGLLNSGIRGFMCTLHAESPLQAINRKFDQNMAWAKMDMPRVAEFLTELVDVVVQIKRTPQGIRQITDIYEPKNNHWPLKDGVFHGVQTT